MAVEAVFTPGPYQVSSISKKLRVGSKKNSKSSTGKLQMAQGGSSRRRNDDRSRSPRRSSRHRSRSRQQSPRSPRRRSRSPRRSPIGNPLDRSRKGEEDRGRDRNGREKESRRHQEEQLDSDDEELEGGEGEELLGIKLFLPKNTDVQEVQRYVDRVHYNGNPPYRAQRRTYDSLKFTEVAGLDPGFHDKLMRSARQKFCRYLWIFDKEIQGLIDMCNNNAEKFDPDCYLYKKAYKRIQEWRKNWSSEWTSGVDRLCKSLVDADEVDHTLTASRLPIAYMKHYKYEYLWTLLGSNQSLIDLRATMATPRGNTFYKTIFVWSLTYCHQHKYSTGDDSLPRLEYLRKVRLIGSQAHLSPVKMEDLILLPEKPVAKIRRIGKKKLSAEEKLDDGFKVFFDPDFKPDDDDDNDENNGRGEENGEDDNENAAN